MAGVILRRPCEHTERDTSGEGHVMTEAETRVMQFQAKECQGFPATSKNWKRKEVFSPRTFWMDHGSASTLILNISPPELLF